MKNLKRETIPFTPLNVNHNHTILLIYCPVSLLLEIALAYLLYSGQQDRKDIFGHVVRQEKLLYKMF